MTTSTRPRTALLAVAAAAALTLSGCGLVGGADDAEQPAPAPQQSLQDDRPAGGDDHDDDRDDADDRDDRDDDDDEDDRDDDHDD